MTLSSRISSLTGPDRAVDAEVLVAIKPELAGTLRLATKLPAFTADLNAARSVVPEGWVWMAGCAPDEGYFATVSPTDESGIEADMIDTLAPTPALALLAAAMMARGL